MAVAFVKSPLKFTETAIAGAVIIDLDRIEDERGFFARAWCAEEFRARGLDPALVQCNVSFNRVRGTLRGMHYQAAPHGEVKVVRCTMGSIYDVAVDIREDSPTRQQWIGVELSAQNRRMLYLGEGLAHGFVTLTDDAEVFYQMGREYVAEAARGLRWNDPALAIAWPVQPVVVSAKDGEWPLIRQ